MVQPSPILTKPARLVVRAPNWLGDAIMALPALAAVRAGLPDAYLAIAATGSIAPVFQEKTLAAPDEVLTLPDRAGEAKILSQGQFDAALLLTNSFRSAWTFRRAGILERWGFSTDLRGLLLTRRIARPGGRLHQSAYYSALAAALGFDVTESVPRLSVRPETRRSCLCHAHEIWNLSNGSPGGICSRCGVRPRETVAACTGCRRRDTPRAGTWCDGAPGGLSRRSRGGA